MKIRIPRDPKSSCIYLENFVQTTVINLNLNTQLQQTSLAQNNINTSIQTTPNRKNDEIIRLRNQVIQLKNQIILLEKNLEKKNKTTTNLKIKYKLNNNKILFRNKTLKKYHNMSRSHNIVRKL